MTLEGKVALVAGATRGAGRGIAVALGEAGAIVYCTGRSTRGAPATEGRPETIEETAELVTARGGRGIHVRCDHSVPEQVRELFERVRAEHGRLDILVNDIWGGDALTEFGKTFWQHSLEKGLTMLERGIHTHIITSHFAAALMIERDDGLIIEITDGEQLRLPREPFLRSGQNLCDPYGFCHGARATENECRLDCVDAWIPAL